MQIELLAQGWPLLKEAYDTDSQNLGILVQFLSTSSRDGRTNLVANTTSTTVVLMTRYAPCKAGCVTKYTPGQGG